MLVLMKVVVMAEKKVDWKADVKVVKLVVAWVVL